MNENNIAVGQVWMNKSDNQLLVYIMSINKAKNTAKGYTNKVEFLDYMLDQLGSYWTLTDKSFTRVIFKKFSGGEVIAFLLDNEVNPSRIDSYMHVGQHGEASEDLPASLKGCTPKEYAPLKKELESMGYFLKVVKTPLKFMYKGS